MSSDIIAQLLFMVLGALVSVISSIITAVAIDRLERRRLREIWAREDKLKLLEDIRKLQNEIESRKQPKKKEGEGSYAFVLLFGNITAPVATGFGTCVALLGVISERAYNWVVATPWFDLVGGILGTTVLGFFYIFVYAPQTLIDLINALRRHTGSFLAGISYITSIVLLVNFELIMIITIAKLLQSITASYLLRFWQALFSVSLPFLVIAIWQTFRHENRLRRLQSI